MRPCLVGLILVSTACGGASGDTTLQYYLVSDPRSLDPALSTDVTREEVITLLYET
jgi:hypothetical protein